jgi:hypothetical protein
LPIALPPCPLPPPAIYTPLRFQAKAWIRVWRMDVNYLVAVHNDETSEKIDMGEQALIYQTDLAIHDDGGFHHPADGSSTISLSGTTATSRFGESDLRYGRHRRFKQVRGMGSGNIERNLLFAKKIKIILNFYLILNFYIF